MSRLPQIELGSSDSNNYAAFSSTTDGQKTRPGQVRRLRRSHAAQWAYYGKNTKIKLFN